jgi:putative ABC transport system substrate-binding protein
LEMNRREVIGLIGSAAAAWPTIARAQQPGKTRRIGVLFALPESDRQAQARLATFRGELQNLGWTDITIDARYAAAVDAELRQRYARELVALQPDVILSQNTDTTKALLQQTQTIPVIFAIVFDPVAEGFAASVPRPGGNATGFIVGEPSMGGKWIELLKEIAPDVTRVLVPFNTASSTAEYYLRSLRASAALLGIDARATFVRDTSELEAVLAEHAQMPKGGLVSIPDSFMTGHHQELTSLAARYRLPAVYANLRLFADAGGLLSYGSDVLDNFRRAAIYADRILRGAKPGELPVQAPVKFELVINLKTAKDLGLVVPQTLLGRANEVIE